MNRIFLCILSAALLCAVTHPCVGQDVTLVQIFQSGDHAMLLDSLRQRDLSTAERFFDYADSHLEPEPCEQVTLKRLHATILNERRDPVRAIDKAEQAMRANAVCGSIENDVTLHLLMGTIYRTQGKSEDALRHFLEATRLDQALSPSVTRYTLFNSAALLHYHSGNMAEAITLLERAIAVYESDPTLFTAYDQMRSVMSAFNTLALAYRNLEKYDEAIAFFRRSRAMAEALGEEFWIGLTHGNIGAVYGRLKHYDSALIHLGIDITVSKRHQQWSSLMNAYLALATIAEALDRPAVAEHYYDSVRQILDRHPSLCSVEYLQRQSELSYKKGDYKASAEFYRKYVHKKDSLNRLEVARNLQLVQSRYEFDTKMAELALVKRENEIKEQELTMQRGLLFGSVSTVLLLFLLVYMTVRRYNQKRRAAILLERQVTERTLELTELNEELDTFLYRASHDFRGPLSTLMGLNYVGNLTVRDPEAADLLKKVGEVATVMDRMLNKIAALHIINRERLRIEPVNLHTLCNQVLARIEPQVAGASVQNDITADHIIYSDEKLLGIALENIIENALKFRRYDNAHTVTIIAGERDGYTSISVSDTGKGIDTTHHNRIFLPFVRADMEKGNGLGLFLVRRCVDRLDGRITFTSQPGQGTVLTIVLPHRADTTQHHLHEPPRVVNHIRT